MGQKLTTSGLSFRPKNKLGMTHHLKDIAQDKSPAEESLSEDSLSNAQVGQNDCAGQFQADNFFCRSLSVNGGDSDHDIGCVDPDSTVVPDERNMLPTLDESGSDMSDKAGFMNMNTKMGYFDAEAFYRDFGLHMHDMEDGELVNSNSEFSGINESGRGVMGNSESGVIDNGHYQGNLGCHEICSDAQLISSSTEGQLVMGSVYGDSGSSNLNQAGFDGEMNGQHKCDFNAEPDVGRYVPVPPVHPYHMDSEPRAQYPSATNSVIDTGGSSWHAGSHIEPNFCGTDFVYSTGSCLPPSVDSGW
jgi:hypothetical protein